jgi:hypothetical protein
MRLFGISTVRSGQIRHIDNSVGVVPSLDVFRGQGLDVARYGILEGNVGLHACELETG